MDTPSYVPTNPISNGIKTLRILVNDRREYLLGIILLLVVVFLWALSNFVTQDIFQGGYEKPFLITWLNTSSFVLYLIPLGLKKLLGKKSHDVPHHERLRSGYERLAVDPTPQNDVVDDSINPGRNEEHLPPLTTNETLQLAAIFCFIWFPANWTVNASLDYTSVASATIMSSMSGFFTLGIGRIFKVESLSVTKVVAVVISFSGVIFVSLSDSSQTATPKDVVSVVSDSISKARRLVHGDEYSDPILGDFLALSSALFYAFYVILLKVRIQQESRINMQLFFGFLGLFNILFMWPLGLVLHFTGVEPFELPSGGKAIGSLFVNMLITLSSDFIYVIAMLKTTPLVVTVGLSLTIPVAVAGDLLLGRTVKLMTLFGAFLILGSFVAVGLEDSKNEEALAEEAAAGEDQAGIQLRISSEAEDRHPVIATN